MFNILEETRLGMIAEWKGCFPQRVEKRHPQIFSHFLGLFLISLRVRVNFPDFLTFHDNYFSVISPNFSSFSSPL